MLGQHYSCQCHLNSPSFGIVCSYYLNGSLHCTLQCSPLPQFPSPCTSPGPHHPSPQWVPAPKVLPSCHLHYNLVQFSSCFTTSIPSLAIQLPVPVFLFVLGLQGFLTRFFSSSTWHAYPSPTLNSNNSFSSPPKHWKNCWNCWVWSSSARTLLLLLPTWRTRFEVSCPGGDRNAYFSLKKEGKKCAGRPKNPRPKKVPKTLRKLIDWERFVTVFKEGAMFQIFLGIKNLKICQSITKPNNAAGRKAQAALNQQITICRDRCRSQSSHFIGYSKGQAQKYYSI